MLFELLMSCCLIGILSFSMINSFNQSERINQSIMTTILLQTKFQAINTKEHASFTISDKQLIEKKVVTEFEDCELSWTENGTASESGSCRGEFGDLRLRPGEGGIGYPWE